MTFVRLSLRCGLLLPVLATSVQSRAQPDEGQSIGIDLSLSPSSGSLAARAEVRPGPVRKDEDVVLMLARSFKVQQVAAPASSSISTTPTSDPFPGLQRIVIHYPRAVSAPVIRVQYAGRPDAGGTPPINIITPSLVELGLDGMWLPIKPDLSMRFTVDARVSGLPRNAVVAAQGKITRAGNVVRIRRVIPDVDFAFVASPDLQRLSLPEFELYAANPQDPVARIYRDHGPRALAFLENWFGPMPGTPARIAVVQRERGSGYARTGYIVLTGNGELNPVGRAKFTAHEFAHSWFRNGGSAGEHRWLDESTAEYVSLRYVEQALGAAARDSLLVPKRTAAAEAGPVFGRDRQDRELYSKGPLLLIELEKRIGRPSLDRLLRQVAHKHVATTQDFLAELTLVADQPAATWFNERLRS